MHLIVSLIVIHCHNSMTSWWRYDVMLWCHMTSWHHIVGQGFARFWPCDLDLRPMTLTIKLGLDFNEINPCTKFCVHMFRGLPWESWLTDRGTDGKTEGQKHGNDSITLTTEAGGNQTLISNTFVRVLFFSKDLEHFQYHSAKDLARFPHQSAHRKCISLVHVIPHQIDLYVTALSVPDP